MRPIQFVCLTIRRASAGAIVSFFPSTSTGYILDYSQVAFAASALHITGAGAAAALPAAGCLLEVLWMPEIIIGLLVRVADPKIPMVNPRRRNDEANQKSFLLAVSLVEASHLPHSQGPGYFTSLNEVHSYKCKKIYILRRYCMDK